VSKTARDTIAGMTTEEIAPWIGIEAIITLIGEERVRGTLLADTGRGVYPFSSVPPLPRNTEAVPTLNATDIVKIEPVPEVR
jgi:hypothetical protein